MSSRKPVVTGDQPCRRGNDSFPNGNGTSAGENSHRTVARADERLTGATDVLVHVTDILNYCKVLVSPPYKILSTVCSFKKTPAIKVSEFFPDRCFSFNEVLFYFLFHQLYLCNINHRCLFVTFV